MAQKKSRKRGTYYIDNVEFLEEIRAYKQTGVISDRLARMITLLAQRVGTHRYFCGYTFVEDMVQEGILKCIEKIDNFDPDKSSNPFAYFTQIIWNVFRQCLNSEKKQYDIRDALLIENMCNPSYNYHDRHSEDATKLI